MKCVNCKKDKPEIGLGQLICEECLASDDFNNYYCDELTKSDIEKANFAKSKEYME